MSVLIKNRVFLSDGKNTLDSVTYHFTSKRSIKNGLTKNNAVLDTFSIYY
mgnify:CR=1 FL=1